MGPRTAALGIIARAREKLLEFKRSLVGAGPSPWEIIAQARAMLIELARGKGIRVHEVHITATFEKWDDGIGVWIFFPTDADLEEYSRNGVTEHLEGDVRNILRQLKYPFRRFPRVSFAFDSDENVQKNYEGSYFYRFR